MTYRKTTKQSLAMLLAVVMATSMLAAAFVGPVAGDVSSINDFDAESDLIVGGEDTVEQTLELEKVQFDGEDTITISDDDGESPTITSEQLESIESQAASPHGEDDFTDDAIDSVEIGDDNIEITHDAEESLDLRIVVELDLTGVEVEGESDDVTYEADAAETAITDTFDLFPAQPEYNDAAVPDEVDGEDVADVIEVDFEGEVSLENEDAAKSAFALDNFENNPEITAIEDDGESEPDSVLLFLDDYIQSNDDNAEISYTPQADVGIANNDNSAVEVAEFSGEEVNIDEVEPVFDSAEIPDADEPDQLEVTFSEDVEVTGSDEDINNAFTLATTDADLDGFDEAASSEATVILDLTDAEDVAADENYDGVLSYNGDNEGADDPVEAANSDAVAADFDSGDVDNNIAPRSADDAEVNNEEVDELDVEFDSDITVVGDDDDISNAFDVDGATVEGSADDSGSTVTLDLEDDVTTADELTVSYTGADGNHPVESTQGTAAADFSGESVTNNVNPFVVDAEITDDEPGEIRVTFSEDISVDGNDDNVATDRFSLEGGVDNADLVHQGDVQDGNVFVLNITQDETTDFEYAPGDEEKLRLADNEANEDIVSAADEDKEALNTDTTGDEDRDVTNNVLPDNPEVVEVTATEDETTATNREVLEVTFSEDIEQIESPNQVENAFGVEGHSQLVSYVSLDEGETTDTIEFEIDANSNTDIDELAYGLTEDGVDEPLVAAADNDREVETFASEAVDNEINPYITHAEVDDPESELGEIDLTYSEEIELAGGDDAENAFELNVDEVEVDEVIDEGGDELTLDLNSDLTKGDFVEVTYTAADADENVQSIAEANADAIDQTETVTGLGEAESNPVLESAYVDREGLDAGNQEIVLVFNEDVAVDGEAETGLDQDDDFIVFDPDERDVDLTINAIRDESDQITNGDTPDNVVILELGAPKDDPFELGDNLDESLTLADPSEIPIQNKTVGGDVVATDGAVDVDFVVADELDDVETVNIDADYLGTEVHGDDPSGFDIPEPTRDNPEITASGFADSNEIIPAHRDVKVEIRQNDEVVATSGELTIDRFARLTGDDGVSTDDISPTDIDSSEVDLGEDVEIAIVDDDLGDSGPVGDTDDATVVHEAFETTEDGYQLVSQPLPGELLTNDSINDESYYNPDADDEDIDFPSYDADDDINAVNNGLFIHVEEGEDAEYGFVFDEDRDVQNNFGNTELSEGWHILGANYQHQPDGDYKTVEDLDVGDNALDIDLNIEQSPSDDAVDVYTPSVEGTTLPDSTKVSPYTTYYVYLYEGDDRTLSLAAYEDTTDAPTIE